MIIGLSPWPATHLKGHSLISACTMGSANFAANQALGIKNLMAEDDTSKMRGEKVQVNLSVKKQWEMVNLSQENAQQVWPCGQEAEFSGITCHLVLGGITDESLSVSEGHIGRSGSVALVVGNNFHSVVFPNTDATWLFREIMTRKEGRSKSVQVLSGKNTKTKKDSEDVSKDCRWFQGQCQ